jgi:large subunit ribosomal protein L21
MFAIVATSGKQFRVSEGDRILVDRVPAGVGETVRLDSVLMLGGEARPMVGTPLVAGALVDATVVAHRSGEKIIVFKFEARKRHRRKIGHRQLLSELKIGAIHSPGQKAHREDEAATKAPIAKAPTGKAPAKSRKTAAAAGSASGDPETQE